MVGLQILIGLIGPLFFAGLAMVVCLKTGWFNFLNRPVDAGRNWFGNNKTWLGLTVMPVGTAVAGMALWQLAPAWESFWADQSGLMIILSYFGVGFAYSLGELPNSFLKRRLRAKAGDLPIKFRAGHRLLDLADGLVVAGIAYRWLFGVGWGEIWLAIGIGILIHWLIERTMVSMGLKPE